MLTARCMLAALLTITTLFGPDTAAGQRAPRACRAVPRVVRMTVHPAIAPATEEWLPLLPKRTDEKSNAAELYIKAAAAMPADLDTRALATWADVNTPIKAIPADRAEALLRRLSRPLDLLKLAAACKQCQWTMVASGQTLTMSSKLRTLGRAAVLQARLQVSKGKTRQAIESLGLALAMAGRMGECPDLMVGMIGIAIAKLTLQNLGACVQQAGSPSLYHSLRQLPRPPVDLAKSIAQEVANAPPGITPTLGRVELTGKLLSRHVAMLGTIEALRLHAGANAGALPDTLADVTVAPVPKDPVTGKPFIYSRSVSKAVLEAPTIHDPAATTRDAVRYELTLANRSDDGVGKSSIPRR